MVPEVELELLELSDCETEIVKAVAVLSLITVTGPTVEEVELKYCLNEPSVETGVTIPSLDAVEEEARVVDEETTSVVEDNRAALAVGELETTEPLEETSLSLTMV
ncbi:hypothetical protein WICPIJ_006238 [Wickerhamomyces pijperi]|uniref:Uncharacterized protein n=1 Tax=Wickerhamomyces pijperi TaxID=599730 RepID=A0A9P8Q4M5_WICPI|nr:hypothetical protein WICPIJ_006238 [Wickerhamomyces pijperi]